MVARARGYVRFEDTVMIPASGCVEFDITLVPGASGPGPHGERSGECHEYGEEGPHGPGEPGGPRGSHGGGTGPYAHGRSN